MIRYLILAFLIFTNAANANSFGLYNTKDNVYEVEKEANRVRSIASITKLFTAYTIIKSGVDLSEEIKVNGRSSGRFPNGARVQRYELLRAMLMSSDNRSAESLANSHPGGYQKFLADVNTNVNNLGLRDTTIADSTGILGANVSTVYDLTRFLLELKEYPRIKFLSSTKQHNIEYISPKRKKPVTVTLRNTNQFVFAYDEIVLTKTGFTNAAGRCLAMLVDMDGVLYALITLGNNNVNQRSRVINNMLSNHIELASK